MKRITKKTVLDANELKVLNAGVLQKEQGLIAYDLQNEKLNDAIEFSINSTWSEVQELRAKGKNDTADYLYNNVVTCGRPVNIVNTKS